MKFVGFLLVILFVLSAHAQQGRVSRDFALKENGLIEITNFYGKVSVTAEEASGDRVFVIADAQKSVAESEVKTDASGGRLSIAVAPANKNSRIDLTVKIPLRARVRVETGAGEVRIAGNVESADVTTDTGTISTDVPLDALKFNFLWTASRPRYLSDADLPKEVREKSGGRFVLSGKLGEESKKAKLKRQNEEKSESGKPDDSDKSAAASENAIDESEQSDGDKKKKSKDAKDRKNVELNFTTARGIVLLNVNPSEVPSNLQERPLTTAARAIIQSGDGLLTEAIRRSSPKFFGDYLKTLPPRKSEPTLTTQAKTADAAASKIKQVIVKVTDINNRAVSGLQKDDFAVTENGQTREILSVKTTTAPFNLVLLLDVSGSVDNYIDFIRKAARNFVNTMKPDDRISIVIFNEDVKQISTFTTDRQKLSESLDTFEAGGGTAYYDAIAYSLVETLRPLRGERTAIVALTDGDDNRSFLPFESLIGSIQESGALIYPLYVPSGLIAASAATSAENTDDPLRSRYMALTSKAETEGARLAEVSGGVYYPIRRLSDLQKAYDDIVVQLRTAYTVTFRSDSPNAPENHASPRLKIRVNRPNSFVNLGNVTGVLTNKTTENIKFSPAETSEIFDYPKERGEPGFVSANFFQPPPEITGEINEIKYKPLLTNHLQTVSNEDFDINKSPPAFIFGNLAVSRWVSPKRTRSYPYERVYNTLLHPKRATIIPIFKDEGADGERDFLQFDTVSLLNLLDVYLILGYYGDAARDSSNNLIDQKFDRAFINEKIRQLQNFTGTATVWNFQQLREIPAVLEKAKTAYAEISERADVTMHDAAGVENFQKRIGKNLEEFRTFSRRKSQNAQNREFQTVQPKEALSSDTKGRVTISDKSGGKYFFTCDETRVEDGILYLIEDKHTVRAKIPSPSDIKDGLLKMMLYSNLQNVRIGGDAVSSKPVLRLTSNKISGAISAKSSAADIENFFQTNQFNANQKGFIQKLFDEARANNFEIRIERAEIAK